MKCGAAILLAFVVAAETDDAHCGYAADAWRITPAEQTGNMGDSWTVRELHVYEDSECEGDPIQATSVFSKPSKPDRSDIVDGWVHVARGRARERGPRCLVVLAALERVGRHVDAVALGVVALEVARREGVGTGGAVAREEVAVRVGLALRRAVAVASDGHGRRDAIAVAYADV